MEGVEGGGRGRRGEVKVEGGDRQTCDTDITSTPPTPPLVMKGQTQIECHLKTRLFIQRDSGREGN